MNRRIVFASLGAGVLLLASAASNAQAFDLLGRVFQGHGHHDSCCAAEPTCCEPEPSCYEPELSCGEPVDCGNPCRRHRCLDFLRRLFHHHRKGCCEPEPSCCEPEPSCCG